ncbi:hypothetical protein SB717_36005, partial [Priestia sp. SIMBA_032]|uniref:hypothetical protein n=1 Tax=Priestia sp. SIMBA_032 TaxID=3085775 RepID=UPI00397C43D2
TRPRVPAHCLSGSVLTSWRLPSAHSGFGGWPPHRKRSKPVIICTMYDTRQCWLWDASHFLLKPPRAD